MHRQQPAGSQHQKAGFGKLAEQKTAYVGGACSYLPVFWLLRMGRLVAAAPQLRLPLVVQIAASAAMVWVCIVVSKVVSSFSALIRWLQTLLPAW